MLCDFYAVILAPSAYEREISFDFGFFSSTVLFFALWMAVAKLFTVKENVSNILLEEKEKYQYQFAYGPN